MMDRPDEDDDDFATAEDDDLYVDDDSIGLAFDCGADGDDFDSEYYEDDCDNSLPEETDTPEEGEQEFERDEDWDAEYKRHLEAEYERHLEIMADYHRQGDRFIEILSWLRTSRFAKPLPIGLSGFAVDGGQLGKLRSGEDIEILEWLAREQILWQLRVDVYTLELERGVPGIRARLLVLCEDN